MKIKKLKLKKKTKAKMSTIYNQMENGKSINQMVWKLCTSDTGSYLQNLEKILQSYKI